MFTVVPIQLMTVKLTVKILKDEYLNNEEFIRRFKNESKSHRNAFTSEYCKGV